MGYSKEIAASPGDLLVCGTDGIVEARLVSGEMCGRNPLVALVEKFSNSGPTRMLAEVEDAVRGQPPATAFADDCTFVAVKLTD